jgi:hypothetical protein
MPLIVPPYNQPFYDWGSPSAHSIGFSRLALIWRAT